MVETAITRLPSGGLAQAAEGSSPSTSPRSRLSFFFPFMDQDVPSLLSSASIAAGVSIAKSSRTGATPTSPDASLLHSPGDYNATLPSTKWMPLGTWSTACLALACAVVHRCLAGWQTAALGVASVAILLARAVDLTAQMRGALRPYVYQKVVSGTKTVQAIQRHRNAALDAIMGAMARTVSIEFYTAFLPIVFWSGRQDLGMMLACLLAICLYLGNGLKDVVCAPRPFSPPVERVTGSKMEEHSSHEYGLPSTHTINIISLSLYMLHWLQDRAEMDPSYGPYLVAFLFVITVVVVFGRLYLGMHSPIDLAVGLVMGVLITAAWSVADTLVLEFLRDGPNALAFSLAVCSLALLAYPTPEDETPSFEDHTSFVGVIMGLCTAFSLSLAPGGASLLPLQASSIPSLIARAVVGLPVVLASKAAGKEAGKLLWPAVLTGLGVPIYSKKYLKGGEASADAPPQEGEDRQGKRETGESDVDVDVLIRLTQYGALSWSVLGLVPLLIVSAGI